jgi:murein L,D-transpeptidase YafK
MERMWSNISLYVRLVVLALVMSCLSPGPEANTAKPSGIAAKAASLGGELRIIIQKSRNVLTLYKGMTPVKSYWAAFGKGHRKGDKRRAGDKRTPEGDFYICSMNHSERFYKFMGISYPGIRHAEDAMKQGHITYAQYLDVWWAIAERRQPPWDTALGGAIGIHGRMLDSAITQVPNPANWTDGCIALNNEDVDEIYSVASVGTPVTILP